MRNLVTIDKNREQFYDNIQVTEQEEEKLTSLLRAGKLPPTFSIRGTQIVTDTILGFSDKPVSHQPKVAPKFKSWDEFAAWARQQKWYQKRPSLTPPPQTAPQHGLFSN